MSNKPLEYVWLAELYLWGEGQDEAGVELLAVGSSYKTAKSVIDKYIKENEPGYKFKIRKKGDFTYWDTGDGTMFSIHKVKVLY